VAKRILVGMAAIHERPEETLAALFAARLPNIDENAIKVYLAILDSGAAHRSAQSRLFESLRTRRTQGRFAVIRALSFSDNGSLTQREIRNDTRVTAPNVSQLIDALERDGLVRREGGLTDRRVTYVTLTPAGHRLAEVVVPAMARLMITALEGFTAAEKSLFYEFLARVRSNIEGAPPSADVTSEPIGRK
jgi:DNA-binding MarR family transcriptional regulator